MNIAKAPVKNKNQEENIIWHTNIPSVTKNSLVWMSDASFDSNGSILGEG